MCSDVLKTAREFEQQKENLICNKERPLFHLTPKIGWMNDPNGLSYYGKKYHLFYQYYPYDTKWGPMYWGHAVSEDLVKWEYLPAALAPDMPYDAQGCFSGSAIETTDGKHLLMYTGVMREGPISENERWLQRQCMAIGDGLNYEKYECNPVLDEKDLPEGCDRYEFRDPKMWRDEAGIYHCVVVSCDEEKDGMVLHYSSQDAKNWKFEKKLMENHHRIGKIWECPDYFVLEDKHVLIVSPLDVNPHGYENQNRNSAICFVGDSQDNIRKERYQCLDYGIDFYAPQTVLSPDGRRIMIGWLQNWDTCDVYRGKTRWFGQMSVPRELSLRNGKLLQSPIREIEQLRKNELCYQNVLVNGNLELDGILGRQIDLELEIMPGDSQDSYRRFTICFAKKGEVYSSICYFPFESKIVMERPTLDLDKRFYRECRLQTQMSAIKMRILLDRYSAEVFINQGEYVFSMVTFADETYEQIAFETDGKVKMNIKKYELMFI